MRAVALLALITAIGFVACDDDDPLGPDIETFNVTLTGAAEAPEPGDPNGAGTAVIEINDTDNEVCWDITVTNITLPATAAHIHEAPAGEPGDIVVTLGAPDATGTDEDCVDAADNLLDQILADPDGYYVNVHTTDFPQGAVRGQLSN